jgi:hypothetical protein
VTFRRAIENHHIGRSGTRNVTQIDLMSPLDCAAPATRKTGRIAREQNATPIAHRSQGGYATPASRKLTTIKTQRRHVVNLASLRPEHARSGASSLSRHMAVNALAPGAPRPIRRFSRLSMSTATAGRIGSRPEATPTRTCAARDFPRTATPCCAGTAMRQPASAGRAHT